MSNFILNDLRFLFDGRDLSGDGNTIQVSEMYPMLDATKFTDTAKINRPGLPTGKFSYVGFSQFGVGLVEETIANHKASANIPILAAKSGNLNDRCHFFLAAQATINTVGGKVGEIQGFTIDGPTANYPVIDGNVLESGKTVRSSTPYDSAPQLIGAAVSGQSLYAILHILAFTGTTLTLTIQSAAAVGFSSPTNRLQQTGITGVGGYFLAPLAGPITDTYYRVESTGTYTSFQAAVAIGIL
jgi:hypothetical protein